MLFVSAILPIAIPMVFPLNMYPVSRVPSLTIPPEIFPLIASFIPLRSAPHTLHSLALGNRRFYAIVRPLLYSRIILRNEDDALTVIQKILDEPHLGLAITELYIMSELSVEAHEGEKPFDVLAGLQMLLKKQLIPRVVALGIYLLDGWLYDKNCKPLTLRDRLNVDFWRSLRSECPRLHTLALLNVGYGLYKPWLTESVIDEINSILGLGVLRLEWLGVGLSAKKNLNIINNVPRHASTLHTLHLKSLHRDITPLLSVSFSRLKSLHLHYFVCNYETPKVMDFFRRHPQLERLSLVACLHNWFSKDIKPGFLPNLKYLKARFDDIRILVPILPQLASLSFTESYNGQVPYLVRVLVPSGLPQLKSLEIEQETASWENRKLEGVLWYEALDGNFKIEKRRKKVPRNFMDRYTHSIVRGAPNLEELGLHGMYLNSDALQTLGPELSQLARMERFYYRGISPNREYSSDVTPETYEKSLSGFLSSAEALARVCPRLATVTSISAKYLPYVSGIIERDSTGSVTGIRQSKGFGMLISADENDPFPSSSDY